MWLTHTVSLDVVDWKRNILTDDDCSIPAEPHDWLLRAWYCRLMLLDAPECICDRITSLLLHGSRAMDSAAGPLLGKARCEQFGKPGLTGSCAQQLGTESPALTCVAGTPNGDLFSEHAVDVRMNVAEEMWSFSTSTVATDSRIERFIGMMGSGARDFEDDDEEDFGGEETTGVPQALSQIPILPEFMPGALPGTDAATGSGANGTQQSPFAPGFRTPLGSPAAGTRARRARGLAAIEDSDSGEDDQTVRKAYGKAPKFTGLEKDWSDWSWRYQSWAAITRVSSLLEKCLVYDGSLKLADVSSKIAKKSRMVYHTFVNCLEGRALTLLRSIERGNGFLAWRKLNEY